MRNTRRKSNEEHKANGTWKQSRHGDFNMPIEIPKPPKSLSKASLQVWKNITPLFYEAGVITRVDWMLVSVLCDSIVMYRTAQADIETVGMTYTSESRYGTSSKANPAIAVRDNCVREIIQILRQFGLTPLARGQRPNTEKTDDTTQKLATFLGV